MEESKKSMNLKKRVLCVFGVILIIGLIITVQGLSKKIDIAEQNRKNPFNTSSNWGIPTTMTSDYINGRTQESNEKLMIGAGIILVSGAIVYLTYTNKFDIKAIMNKSKKKVAKKLKKILEEEGD